ncbi:MAG TPA: LacI family DNA-binding transcriptional regulator [Acidobacteriaceae bacterium]|nr:LacI family DNA-binding transcriptional regulator [Acidobacteriaceae bacterium]
MRRSTTMADVARLAGVGKMTVSRVLSGSAKVAEPTAARVQRAIRMLDYQPNELARSLRSDYSKTIAVIVPYLYDPFFATCAHAISTVAKSHGYSVILTTSDEEHDTQQKQTSLMARRRIDGMVIIPAPGDDDYLRAEMFSRVHIVALDRPVADPRFDSVLVNNRAGAKMAVDHLIGHGHRNIRFIGIDRELYTLKARYAGYRQAMSRAALPVGPYIECQSPDQAVAALRAAFAGKRPPTALFAGNNLTMRYLLHALTALRVQVPEQVALAGFDDFDVADVLQPTLTVVRQPVYKIGEVAANLLFERILRREFPSTGRRVVLPLELIVRCSCGCTPAEQRGNVRTAAAGIASAIPGNLLQN